MENQNQSSVPPSSSPPEQAPNQPGSSEPITQNTQSPQGETVATSVGTTPPFGSVQVPPQTTPGVSPMMKIAIITLALLVVGGLGFLGFQMLSDGSDENVDVSVDDTGNNTPVDESGVEETPVESDEDSMMQATPTISDDTSTATIEAELNSIDIPTGDADVADLTTEASGL